MYLSKEYFTFCKGSQYDNKNRKIYCGGTLSKGFFNVGYANRLKIAGTKLKESLRILSQTLLGEYKILLSTPFN